AGPTVAVFSFFQAEDGIRDFHVTGVQTCALPILDLLVAMNAAALKVNLGRVRPGGTVIVNTNSFERRDLELAHYDSNPLEDGTRSEERRVGKEGRSRRSPERRTRST